MRTLRRPMFRIGGKSEVGNDGIMSGLVDREELQAGTAKEKFESVAKQPSLFGFRFNEPFFSIPTPEKRMPSGTGFEFMSPKKQSPGLTKIGEAISDRNPRMDELGLDELAKPVRYSPSQEKAMAASDLQIGEGDLNLSPTDIKGLQEFYKTINVKGNLDYKGGIPEVKTEVKDEDTSQITTKDNISSNVVTQAEKNAILKARAKEFEELLNPGARKRVINNALAEASEQFGKSTGNTMQDIANAITAAAKATGKIDETKAKAAELAIGESIQKGIAREKKPAIRPNATESLINFYRESGLSNKEIADKISKTSESELDYIRAYPVASQGKAAYVSNVEMKDNPMFGGVLSNDKKQRNEELKTLNPDKLYYDSSKDAYVKIVTGDDGKQTVQIVSKR